MLNSPDSKPQAARTLDRRVFMKTSAIGIAAGSLLPLSCAGSKVTESEAPILFDISLAEWSLHRALGAGEITNLQFPVVSRAIYGIDAVEYVNSFMREESRNPQYVQQLKSICDSEGVRSLLIMCDGEGRLGDPDKAARKQSVDNHRRWIDTAAELGCHSIRVNAASEGDWNEQRDLAADGLASLAELGAHSGIGVIVENHGGLSSNGRWLAEVMSRVNHKNCGTLPDFGNFNMGGELGWYDIYQGIEELMPFAKAVSAKSHAFDDQGQESGKDYLRIMRTVLDAGYRGYVGIEYEGSDVPEPEGIHLTKRLLERCRETLAAEYS